MIAAVKRWWKRLTWQRHLPPIGPDDSVWVQRALDAGEPVSLHGLNLTFSKPVYVPLGARFSCVGCHVRSLHEGPVFVTEVGIPFHHNKLVRP